MNRIDIHADDFGESLHASEDILECVKAGKLDSISVLPNMNCFAKCVERYREEQAAFPVAPKLSVHLNFMEGRCLSEPAAMSGLADGDGYFIVSWKTLFFRSWLPGRETLKNQLKMEMLLQIEAVRRAFPEMEALRIDSHQHTHMIPVVADALFEVLTEGGWQVEYIRDVREPMLPFLRAISLYKTYRPVNFVKNMILNFCSRLMEGRLQALHLEPMYLWGLVMSGHMDEARVQRLYPAMQREAEKHNRTLEVLFHPGQVLPQEIAREFSQREAMDFYVSGNRQIEKTALMRFVK